MPSGVRGHRPVAGLKIGQATSEDGSTGVTALVFDHPAPTVVDVRGGASATYDLASLSLDATFGVRWGLFLAGGSLFGLDAAAGVRQCILEAGGGVEVFGNPHRVAPVSGAALFDLPRSREPLADYRALGYAAAEAASRGRVAEGRVGAGAGATVGKYRGRGAAMHGGVGWASRPLGRGRVGALVAINSVGAVRDPSTGRWVAGSRTDAGAIALPTTGSYRSTKAHGTTLSIVVTDLDMERPALQRAAFIAHAALGGTVVPYQTATDGDVLFAASTRAKGRPSAESRPGAAADALGALSAECLTEAVLDAVRAANRLD